MWTPSPRVSRQLARYSHTWSSWRLRWATRSLTWLALSQQLPSQYTTHRLRFFLTGKPFTFIAPTTPPGLIIALHPTHSRLVAEPSSPWLGAHVVLVFTRRLRSSPRASLVEPPKGDGDDYVAKTRHPCRRRDHRNWGGMAQLQGALI